MFKSNEVGWGWKNSCQCTCANVRSVMTSTLFLGLSGHLEEAVDMLPGSAVPPVRAAGRPHHVIYGVHDVRHLLHTHKGDEGRLPGQFPTHCWEGAAPLCWCSRLCWRHTGWRPSSASQRRSLSGGWTDSRRSPGAREDPAGTRVRHIWKCVCVSACSSMQNLCWMQTCEKINNKAVDGKDFRRTNTSGWAWEHLSQSSSSSQSVRQQKNKRMITSKLTEPLSLVSNALKRKCAYILASEGEKRALKCDLDLEVFPPDQCWRKCAPPRGKNWE